MLKTILVRELIEDGQRLLQELDRLQFTISAALWYYVPERMNWKFIIVSQVAGAPGPLEAYMRIQQAMARLEGLSFSLDDILVMSPGTRGFQDLRRTIEGASQVAVAGQRISLEGVTFEDAYIYRWPSD